MLVRSPVAQRSWVRRPLASRLLAGLAVPLTLAIPALFWVLRATERAAATPLGRDQGIFQYVAWAMSRGAVDYRDVRDINGPLVHLLYLVFLFLGGGDEHRFRVLDLVVTGATFAFVGACLAGLASSARPTAAERVAWGLAGWVVLNGQYLLYGFWDLAQRESFLDWFMLPSVALQLVAQAPRGGAGGAGRTERGRWSLLVVVGALSVAPWFGKPTYVLFTLAQLAALVADPGMALPRRRALAAFAAGGAITSALMLLFVVWRGDLIAYAHIQLVEVPLFRFVRARSIAQIMDLPWVAHTPAWAAAGTATLLALIALGKMPRRMLAVALVPVCALGSVVLQAKGYPYHLHPLTAGVYLQGLVLVAWLTGEGRVIVAPPALARGVPVAASAVLAVGVATAMIGSPHLHADWLASGERGESYFEHYKKPGFSPFEMRLAAAYLQEHTSPEDRVQTYGADPYLLFLAARSSATPYIYALDLNADAALLGGVGFRAGPRPNAVEKARIRSLRDAHEDDMLRRVSAQPPAAFVFFDDSPVLSMHDAWADFQKQCPRTAAWVSARYVETRRFEDYRIWLRRDGAPQ